MKVKLTFDLDEDTRMAIGKFFGQEGPASYDDCVAFLKGQAEAHVQQTLRDLVKKQQKIQKG